VRGEVVALPIVRRDSQELLDGLRSREPGAVADLLNRYSDLVRRFITRTLGSAVDVDDLAQETFLIVLRRCADVREPEALRSFVVSVAIRVARNELRKRAIRRFVGLDTMSDLPVVAPHDPAIAQGLRHLYRALDRLDADCRIAFLLRNVEGYDLMETAQTSGCSLATVKRRLARAEKRFQALAAGDPVLRAFLDAGRRDV
jgi:RNA polymerase sigma-70 factor (ECF subfamily)